ncbi:amidohydrolase [Ensifer adhaerens]|uniref:amidohydrolase family protein n=1 Tax=Ensifer adhaerens TaxID=106592 RepID=UPI001CBC8A71|nr:amidohydrolase family protein [Ensifer adhaerens]MBZ7924177.1 amidohydrolase [Ensifer adhaerens]UAX96565.1 amidohydrolase [Ensifer adhaerens]UAY04091.1 amidohydrolase [Ensifer adhaerens]UAY12077.1 amidohydrolase [Ensifer adhaerens]
MIVDMHNHIIPQASINRLLADVETFGVAIDADAGRIAHREGFAYPLFREFIDPIEKLRQLDERGFDKAVISPSPTLFFYRAEARRNVEFVRQLNEDIAAFAAQGEGRLLGMGTLPMQSPEDSVAELDYLVDHLGIRSVMIGTHIDGVQLSAPQFRPVLKHAADRGVFVLLHPYYFGSKPGLEDYYLTNLIGNPLDTAVAAAHLIFSGVMEELPKLKICLSHGGGFIPYQVGRLVHGQLVRKEAQTTRLSAKQLLRRFYFDTITHDVQALKFLLDLVGPEQVLLGTDIPFDMADLAPMSALNAIEGLSDTARSLVAGGNALRLIAA